MRELKTLSLCGSPYERGTAHGEHFREDIQAHMKLWKENTEEELKMPVDAYLGRFFRETAFLPAIEKYAPDILEEVRGLAAGCGLPFEWVLARQLSDEEPWYRNTIKFDIPLPQNCTTIGLRGEADRPNLIAQNMDTPKYYDGFQLLLEIQEENSDLVYKVFTVTGKISLCGMNNYGVGITCNSLIQLNFNPKGLPEDFIVRKALQSRSFKEMQDFLLSVPHASGQNYLYGGPDGIQSLECSAGGKTNSMLDDSKEIFYHTNHPVCSLDTAVFDQALQALRVKDPGFYESLTARLKRDTYTRFDVVKDLMEKLNERSIEGLMSVLRDRTSPLSIELTDEFSNFTLGSIMMVLDRNNPTLFVTNGPAHNCEYEKFDF